MLVDVWSALVALTLLSLTPGVDTLLVIRNSSRGGVTDGVFSSLGICTGLFVHATVSAVGISVILLQSAIAFSVLKYAGAAYLIWLGFTSLRQMKLNHGLPVSEASNIKESISSLRSFREGLLSNVLNPKTVIFYMAFMPQFINSEGSAFWQSQVLAGLHFVICMSWQCFLAFMMSRARHLLASPRFSKAFHGMTGSVMVMLGLKLALVRQ